MAYTGETPIEHNGKKVVAFLESGEWTIPDGVTKVDVLVVAGGGGGGNSRGGGGGAGGLIFRPNYQVESGTSIDVVVGQGGSHISGGNPGENGDNSSFDNLIALGGGGGGAVSGSDDPDNYNGNDGGSGGGARRGDDRTTYGGSGTQPSQSGDSGSPYGFGNDGSGSTSSDEAAGGGGAGEPGTLLPMGEGQTGGDGLKEVVIEETTYNFATLFGTNYGVDDDGDGEAWFAGGGGGQETTGGKGGGGEGCHSNECLPGTENTGGGGGGDRTDNGTDGGSGIVLIAYEEPTIEVTTQPATNVSFESAELNGEITE